MSSKNSISRLSKAKNLLAHFQSQQLQSQNYIQIRINLKGLKYIENPNNGQRLSWDEVLKLKINDKITQKIYTSSSRLQDDPFAILLVRNTATINKLKTKFGEKNFHNQSLQLYCKGKLLAGNDNLMKIKEIVEKYKTNVFTCERMETFG